MVPYVNYQVSNNLGESLAHGKHLCAQEEYRLKNVEYCEKVDGADAIILIVIVICVIAMVWLFTHKDK